MSSFRAGNLMLAFLLELAMLAALALFGWHVAGAIWLRLLLAIGLPAVAIAAWAVWGAPKSKSRLQGRALLLFKVVMFALATAAWFATGEAFIGTIFAVLVVVNLLGGWVFRQA